MIKNKVTMHDLLIDHCNGIGVDPERSPGTFAVTSRDFYAGAAAMASQFATNGILYLPGAGNVQAPPDTPWSDEALKTVGGEVQGEVQL